ncbi:uncharacterized protein LODBEIA_P43790 [Lodderomyces beijingensis]|uniref:Mitochondrial distribution and morphology protein 34 n=1 Tax=Lodderomyces beijingensis TaxID=1775926 RepID=A0ABP0ZV75_9ASCO
MSFKVNWSSLETDSLSTWTKEILTSALNSGKRPNILASNITIKDLNFGQAAPDFEILEIGELDKDRFRGIFKINYSGDFHLTLHTQVQANPLNIYYSNSLEREVANGDLQFVTPRFGLSNEKFAIPLDLKLSDIQISGIGIIVFSKSKGLTLVFRNDPLDSIKVSSTFDTVQVLANFLQKQIESQIRDLFRETLPTLIHQLSLKYLSLDNNMSELRTRLAANITSSDNTTLPLKILDGGDKEDFSMIYSSKNLRKNLQLFKSRENMSLHIPKLKFVVQRTHMDKFKKNYPNLLNSLAIDNAELQKFVQKPNSNNGVPIDIFETQSYQKTDGILKDISSIQATNFYKFAKDPTKPKRRVIKLGKKKSLKQQPRPETPAPATSTSVSTGSETTSIMTNEPLLTPMEPMTPASTPVKLSPEPNGELKSKTPIQHPTPRKAEPRANSTAQAELIYKEFMRPSQSPSIYDKFMHSCGGVGLGNTGYFNFVPQRTLSASPIRRSARAEEEKKSNNYMDFNTINQRLEEKLKLNDDHCKMPPLVHQDTLSATAAAYAGLFTAPPPPYYQASS